jgi:cytochrome c
MYNLLGFIFLQATVAPRDLPLPLPLPEWFLITVLIVSFLLHIIFVDLMVGGVLLTLWAQIKGLKNPDYDHLAHEMAATVTVNKSVAVVLGVGPLLSINVLYTLYFYTANALTGTMWIMIIPLVTVAFLLTYLHKYTWHKLENNKPVHISIIAMAAAIFLFIPFIFLTNVNLMLFPEKWTSVKGFLSAMLLPNVLPRYVFFIFSTLAVTGLFMAWYFGREKYDWTANFKTLDRYDMRRKFYSLTLVALFVQLVLAGPILMVTLPAKGMSWNVVMIVLMGAGLVIFPIYWIWQSITGPAEGLDRHFKKIVATLLVTISVMGMGRHAYRAHALAPHQELTARETEKFSEMSKQAFAEANDPAKLAERERNLGPNVFKASCSTCHDATAQLVGPPITEMVSIYNGKPQELKNWIIAPGKKRPEAPQMPAFPQLSEKELDAVVAYILKQ